MLEAGYEISDPVVEKACDWLRGRQVLDVAGDWAEVRPGVRPGGWAFQYWNDYYPDVDDTAVVVMGLQRADDPEADEAIERGIEWILGMQSENGGWGTFDADNDHDFLQHIPFADHGALLDPPTADVTARCLGMLAQDGYDRSHPAVVRALVGEGCSALLSFGVAGGLDPAIEPGTVIAAASVFGSGGRRWDGDAEWRDRLVAKSAGEPDIVAAAIAGSDRALLSAAEKDALYQATGAAGVDMETHSVAEAGVPFLAVRAVADPQSRSIPEWIANTIGDDGRPMFTAVFSGWARRPWETPTLFRLATDTGTALASLRRVAALAGEHFCLL